MGRALARSFGIVQIKPGFDPLKAQVHLDLHRLAPQVVAAQIVDVFANALFAAVFSGGKRRVWPVWRRLTFASYGYSSLYLMEQP
jgi:hypothetical protein